MLKNALYRYFSLFMALLVLTSSTGIGMVEKQCSMRGKSVNLSFVKDSKKGCNLCRITKTAAIRSTEDKAPEFRKLSCCTEKQRLSNVEFEVVSGKSDKSLKAFTAVLSSGSTEPISVGYTIRYSPGISDAITFSSPFFGRSMLTFVQRFLI